MEKYILASNDLKFIFEEIKNLQYETYKLKCICKVLIENSNLSISKLQEVEQEWLKYNHEVDI